MSREYADSERRNVRRGLALVATLVMISLGVFFSDFAIRATAEGERITVYATAAPGLSAGSPVWVAGRPMGRVLSVGFRPPGSPGGNIVVHAVLERIAHVKDG